MASSVASSRRVAMSGVLMRPAALTRGASMNADVVAVDGLAGEAARRRAARAGRSVCGPLLSDARPSRAMTRFSPTSGTTSASVPIAAILTNAGSHFALPGARAQRLDELQRDADAGQVLVRIGAVVPLRVDHRQRRRQRRRRARDGR